MSLIDIHRSIRFTLQCVRQAPATADKEIRLDIGNGLAIPADIYEPTGWVRGTIFSIHGMTPLGWRDPRLCVLNRAFANAGFRTVSPLVESIAQLRIRIAQVQEVNALLRACLNQVADGSPFGAFSVSFSGAITLLASAHSSVANHIDAILALGTFSDPDRCFDYLFDSEDDYGRLLGLANAYELACYDDHPIAKGLYYAALDNFYADRAPETPAYVTSLPAKDAEELQQLLTSSQARRRTWETHRDCALELLRTLTVSGEALRNIRGRITLIHGKDDPVIHSSETLALAQSLRNAGRSPQVLVSPLLGHGDPELRWNDLLQAPALIRTFAGFFSDIRTRSTT